jgi:hypothetical protein
LELCREVRLRLSEMTGVKRCIFSLHPAATAGGLIGFTPNVQVTAVTPQHGVNGALQISALLRIADRLSYINSLRSLLITKRGLDRQVPKHFVPVT